MAASWSGQHDPIDGKSGGIVPRSMQALLDRKSWFTELDMYTSCLVVRALLVELFLAVICSSTAPCTVRGVEVAALTLVATGKIVSLFTPRWCGSNRDLGTCVKDATSVAEPPWSMSVVVQVRGRN